MTKLNPYTNKPTRFITKEEILVFEDKLDFTEKEFREIDPQIRCSFELGASKLVNQEDGYHLSNKVSKFKDLVDRIPDYSDEKPGQKHKENFKFWVSELIQNAHDAVWEEEGRQIGPTKFEFEVGDDSFLFSHNGRPPQWIDFAQNEVEKMTKFSTSKHNQYATEGQFGIGFKIWIHMFDEVKLRYGHCELKISINRTGEYHYPEFSTTWYDEEEPKFRIKANRPRSEVSTMLSELSDNNLEEIFQRSIQGLLMRPNPFELVVRTLNYEDRVAKTEQQIPSAQLRSDGFKSWTIDAAKEHGLPQKVITFSQPIEALQYSDVRLSTTLRKEIEKSQNVLSLYKNENPEFKIDEIVSNTLKLFDATITIIPDSGFEWALYNSLFPIPGAFNENLTTTGVHFVAKFAMDEKRQNLAVSLVEKERNDTLMMSLMECYFQMMDGLKDNESRGQLGITDETYYRLIRVFSDNQENDDGINGFVNEISELLNQPDDAKQMKNIFDLLEIYPLLEDGAYSKYLDLKVLRPEVRLLLEEEEEELQNWGESVLDPSEGICRKKDEAFEYYSWNVEAWDVPLRSNEALWEQHDGPEGMDTETLLGHINRMSDFGYPDWLKIPMYRNTESGIEWFTLEELDGHLISRKSEEETVDLSDFEASVQSKLLELGVDELFIDSHWEALIKSQNNGIHNVIDDKIVHSDTLYAERVRLLIKNSDDKGRAFFLELIEQHPQTEAKFPFFFTTEIKGKQEVVKLKKSIPESVLFRKDTTSKVVTCDKSSSHWKILNAMDSVAMVLGHDEYPTHIFVDQDADKIIQDINDISILPHSTIADENCPLKAKAFSGLMCTIPPCTSDDVRKIVLSWVNKIPHVGVPLKLESQHFFDVFDAQVPTNLRRKSGDNDRYIVVQEPTLELKLKEEKDQRKKNHLDDTTAQHLIETVDLMEGDLDKSADKKTYWTQAMADGEFAVLLRVSSYPSVIAENLIEEPSKRNYRRYLRSLRFSHMDINPTFFFLHLGDLYIPKSGKRRIRIVCKKFTAAELRALENANLIMTYLNQNKAYIGCLPESPTEELKKMFGVTPNYKSPSLRNTAAAQWNLVPGKLSSMVFRHALLHRTALLPDTILLKNAPYFEQNPVLAQQAVALLDRLDHQLMPATEFPLEEHELFHHFFSDIPHKNTGKHMLLWELIESIVLKVEKLDQKPNVLLAHSLEALVLSQHQFLNLIDETKHDPYWHDLAAIEFENYKSDDVTWSERFAQLLDRRKQFDANTIKFIDELNGLTDFSKVLNSLRKNGEKRSQRKCGTTLQKQNLPITQQTKVYVVEEDKYDSCFPLTTKPTWLSEHSNIYSSRASIVLTATTEEWSKMNDKFPDEFSQHNTAQRILNEVRTILQAFLEAHTNAGADGERNDAGDESQRRAVEFLRRGVLRYLADMHSPAESSISTADLLKRAYNSIDVKTVSVEQAQTESMFPDSDDEFLSNMLIGPCGIGWSLDNGRLTMTLGPWLNRDWGGEKLNWAKDLFAGLLDGLSLKKRDFREKYDIPDEQLSFLASQGYISGFDEITHWLRKHQDGLLPIDTAFDDFFKDGKWQKVSEIHSLVEQILDKIKRESSEGRLQEAAPSVFKQMYPNPKDLICTISGYVVPDPIGSYRMHTVRLRRPDTATHQPVLDGPTRPNLKGWESIGNTLYVSDRASQTGQRSDGWRLLPPHDEAGSFVDHLAKNIERYCADSATEFIHIPDVVGFKHEDGHNDARFDLQLHKLHSLYIIAYDIYCQSMEES